MSEREEDEDDWALQSEKPSSETNGDNWNNHTYYDASASKLSQRMMGT